MKRTCIQCGKEFSYEGRKERRFCSKPCFGQFRKLPDRQCEGCGVTISGRDSKRFCGKRCVAQLNSRNAYEAAQVVTDTKQCRSCGEQKPFSDFSKQSRGIGGVRARCKPCEVAIQSQMRKDNPLSAEAARRGSRKNAHSLKGRVRRESFNRHDREERPGYYMWLRARNRAAKKGIEFTISPSDITIPEVCPVFGIKMVVAKGYYQNPRGGGAEESFSLDRIDNDYGYIPGNIAVISWYANRLKGDASIEQLEQIVSWMKSQKEIRSQQTQSAA